MPRRTDGPRPPHPSDPDLPRDLDTVTSLVRHDDIVGARIVDVTGDVDAAYARIAECVFAPATLDRLDLRGATLVDVEIEDLRATSLLATDGSWRAVRLRGGRIGTLDLSRARADRVELRGARIDYLTLGQAEANDILFTGCSLGALDVPLAKLERVRFEDCRVDEVDSRELRARDLDLRGLEALAYTDPASLRGATLSARQTELLSDSFATALGIDVRG